MKVAIIGSLPSDHGGSGSGGVAVHTAQIAKHLAQSNVEAAVLAHNVDPSHVSSPAHPGEFRIDAVPPLSRRRWLAGAPAVLLSHIAGSVRKGANVSLHKQASTIMLAARYRQYLNSLRPDLVHIHGVGLGPLALRRALTGRANPMVATVHSLRGHLPDSDFFDEGVPSLRCPDILIAVSEHLRSEAIGYGVAPSKIHVIPNGVDTSYFRPLSKEESREALHIPVDSKNVLFVGHLIHRKGVDFLIRAFSEVCRLEADARLYIVGGPVASTDAGWYQDTLSLPGRLGIVDRVTFVGPVESHKEPALRLWYNACDVLVLPSRAEGMGMVLLEAMACAKPVIGTGVGGICNVISEGENGFLVDPDDPSGLAGAISRILDDAALARRLGEHGLRQVRATYSWEGVADRTSELYRSALSERLSARE